MLEYVKVPAGQCNSRFLGAPGVAETTSCNLRIKDL